MTPKFFDVSMGPPVHGQKYENSIGGMSLCSLLSCIIVFYILYVVFVRAPRQQVVHTSGCASTMKTSVTTASGDDPFVKGVLMKKTHNLTPCHSADKYCTMETFKDTPTAIKEANETKVENFIKLHQTCVIMVYAPWCPHCHTAMPVFTECSMDGHKEPFALVNAELVTHDLMQKLNVTHFPFIALVKKEKEGSQLHIDVLKEGVSKASINNLCSNSKNSLDSVFE